jgi:HPt (histidine-containing phosphotransfer) domain-containing protein
MKPQGECVAGADVTVWDVAGALRRLDGDEELLHEVVGIFLEDIPVHLATLRRAINEGDLEAIERTAHSLKGEMGYLGISDLSLKAGELERLGREREPGNVAQLFAVFDTRLAEVVDAMRKTNRKSASNPLRNDSHTIINDHS